MRSRWRRSIITTSAPSSPRRMSWNTSTPSRAASAGIKVGGPTIRTRAFMVRSRWMLLRATRLCSRSPQIATTSPSSRPLRRRMVSASSSAWVGCSCVPSPGVDHGGRRPSATAAPARRTAPCRTTSRSQCIALRVEAVSSSVSPLFTLLVETDMLMTSAPRRLPASSKEVRVRVRVLEEQVDEGAPAQEVALRLAGAVQQRVAVGQFQQTPRCAAAPAPRWRAGARRAGWGRRRTWAGGSRPGSDRRGRAQASAASRRAPPVASRPRPRGPPPAPVSRG